MSPLSACNSLFLILKVKELQRRGDPNAVIALAGNKADMRDRRQVDAEVRLHVLPRVPLSIHTQIAKPTRFKPRFAPRKLVRMQLQMVYYIWTLRPKRAWE